MTRRTEIALVLALLFAGLGVRWAMTAHWCYAGSDSYGYMRLSDELRNHGRLALGPDQPLQWARLPLYPVFLVVKGDAATDMNWKGDPAKGPGWLRISHAQAFVDLLLMALAVWAMTRKLVGARAALAALALAVFSPFTTPFVGAVLTETWAIALSTAAMAPLILWSERPRRALAISGALVGLGMLLRADAILLAAAFPPALYYLCRSWKERIIAGALAAALALAVFSPWPIRNLIRFGQPHAIGARIDRESRPLENVDGYWLWLRSFARNWQATTYVWTCYYEHSAACQPIVGDLERLRAFDTPEEKSRVSVLLARRGKDGLTPEVDAAFAQLAHERASRSPLFVYLVLPLSRAGNMWVTWMSETLASPYWRPLRPVSDWISNGMFPLTMIQFLLFAGAAAFLLWRPRLRWVAAILVTMMTVRTLILGYTAYCMPRYAVEVMPLGWVLLVAAVAEARRFYLERRSRS
jgi:hypothetical protein